MFASVYRINVAWCFCLDNFIDAFIDSLGVTTLTVWGHQ